MRILQISSQKQLIKIMQEIKVDPCGIKIMVPKGITHIARINSVPCVAANILKQEMLSLGGDVAVAKDTLTGKIKETDCVLMGSISQFNRLNEKLSKQSFGLSKLASGLDCALANYQTDKFVFDLGRYKLNLESGATRIMGIVNLTPDSFSGDGLYKGQRTGDRGQGLIDFVKKMVSDGADIIDLGGESSRPGAKPVSLKEELKRVIPIIKKIAKKIKVPISIDTYKPEVAEQALDNGAVLVNDICGLRNPKMSKIISKYKAAVIIMHMKGGPPTMQKKPQYSHLIDEIIEYLNNALNSALSEGINRDKIIIDPGIGFGKTLEHNLEILNNLAEFKVLGRPILAGASRKSFIGKILNAEPAFRLSGTISACVLAVKNGANILRVHDVKEVKDALKVTQAILNS